MNQTRRLSRRSQRPLAAIARSSAKNRLLELRPVGISWIQQLGCVCLTAGGAYQQHIHFKSCIVYWTFNQKMMINKK
jgi:hypothetical protein